MIGSTSSSTASPLFENAFKEMGRVTHRLVELTEYQWGEVVLLQKPGDIEKLLERFSDKVYHRAGKKFSIKIKKHLALNFVRARHKLVIKKLTLNQDAINKYFDALKPIVSNLGKSGSALSSNALSTIVALLGTAIEPGIGTVVGGIAGKILGKGVLDRLSALCEGALETCKQILTTIERKKEYKEEVKWLEKERGILENHKYLWGTTIPAGLILRDVIVHITKRHAVFIATSNDDKLANFFAESLDAFLDEPTLQDTFENKLMLASYPEKTSFIFAEEAWRNAYKKRNKTNAAVRKWAFGVLKDALVKGVDEFYSIFQKEKVSYLREKNGVQHHFSIKDLFYKAPVILVENSRNLDQIKCSVAFNKGKKKYPPIWFNEDAFSNFGFSDRINLTNASFNRSFYSCVPQLAREYQNVIGKHLDLEITPQRLTTLEIKKNSSLKGEYSVLRHMHDIRKNKERYRQCRGKIMCLNLSSALKMSAMVLSVY